MSDTPEGRLRAQSVEGVDEYGGEGDQFVTLAEALAACAAARENERARIVKQLLERAGVADKGYAVSYSESEALHVAADLIEQGDGTPEGTNA